MSKRDYAIFLVLLLVSFFGTNISLSNVALFPLHLKKTDTKELELISPGSESVDEWAELFTLVNVSIAEGSQVLDFVSTTDDPTGTEIVKCQGHSLCLKGQVVKVVNAKTLLINVNDKIFKVELALITLPLESEQAMIASTTFTRNSCLGNNVFVDQDDGQRGGQIIGLVYGSPSKSLNEMLLDRGYAQLDRSQCLISEFSKLDWAKSRGC